MTATNLALIQPDARPLADLSKEEILQAFGECFGLSLQFLLRSAELYREWCRRGWPTDPLEAIAKAELHKIRLISSGQLDAELALLLSGRPGLLRQLSRFPIDEQRKIAKDEPVEYLTINERGQRDVLMVRPSLVFDATDQRKQLFDTDRIRTLEQQSLWLDRERKRKATPKPDKVGKFNLDRARGGATHRGEFITLAELLEVVKALRK
jgi:hypothetical protein